MLKSKFIVTAAAMGLLVCGTGSSLSAAPQQPDNTKVNKRDQSKGQPTADQGKNNTADRETMQKIRKAIMDDKSLSTYAHNVKVIAQDGKVTLKGPVRSEQEKQSIERIATDVAGSGNVTDEITIKPAKLKGLL
jgi:hyperosmotically inducible protein